MSASLLRSAASRDAGEKRVEAEFELTLDVVSR